MKITSTRSCKGEIGRPETPADMNEITAAEVVVVSEVQLIETQPQTKWVNKIC